MKPEFSLYKAVFPDVLEFHCCRGEREVGGWAREPARAAPSTAETEPDVQENPAQPRPGQVYTGEKSMAIDLQYKGTAALAGGCHLTGAVQGTRRGSPRWGLC